MRYAVGLICAMTLLAIHILAGSEAWAAEPVAYLMEIHRGTNGEVRVKVSDEADWKVPQPLLGLRPGDQVRVVGDGRAVLYPLGGRPQTVTVANSPLTVPPLHLMLGGLQAEDTLARRVLAVVRKSLPLMQGASREVPGGVRGLDRGLPEAEAPVMLSPRETRLFPGRPIFEWDGSDRLRYTIRVRGPEGVLWEEADLPRRPVSYPAIAPRLRPEVVYEWELQIPGQMAQRTRFALLSEPEALRVRDALAILEAGGREGYPPTTVAVMRTAVLFDEGLLQEARSELEGAVLAHRDEPTLYYLLGRVYAAIGLHARAGEAFRKAELAAP